MFSNEQKQRLKDLRKEKEKRDDSDSATGLTSADELMPELRRLEGLEKASSELSSLERQWMILALAYADLQRQPAKLHRLHDRDIARLIKAINTELELRLGIGRTQSEFYAKEQLVNSFIHNPYKTEDERTYVKTQHLADRLETNGQLQQLNKELANAIETRNKILNKLGIHPLDSKEFSPQGIVDLRNSLQVITDFRCFRKKIVDAKRMAIKEAKDEFAKLDRKVLAYCDTHGLKNVRTFGERVRNFFRGLFGSTGSKHRNTDAQPISEKLPAAAKQETETTYRSLFASIFGRPKQPSADIAMADAKPKEQPPSPLATTPIIQPQQEATNYGRARSFSF